MNTDEIYVLAQKLGCGKHSTGGRSIVVTCPLSPWTHNNGQDRKPSCSIFIEPDDMSCYNCFTCHHKGRITDLVAKVNNFRGGGLEELLIWTEKVNHPDLTLRLDRAMRERPDSEVTPMNPLVPKYRVFEETELDDFRGSVPKYVISRGIKIETCKIWNLGYDKTNGDPRLIFAVRDRKGRLVGIVGRTTQVDWEPRYKNYWGFNKNAFLYGEHLLEYISEKPIVLVEGMLDPIAVTQSLDVECVAQMGTFLSAIQREKIISYCGIRPLILLYDNDKAGRESEIKTREALKGRVVVYTAKLPKGKDPAQLAHEDPAALKEAILTAGI